MECLAQHLLLSCWNKILLDGLAACLRLDELAQQAQALAQEQQTLHNQKQTTDAWKQQHLMQRQAKSRMESEGEVGLVIERAVYGVLLLSNLEANEEESGKREGEETLDVTVALQFWVSQGKLELPATSKRDLLGFCDPRGDKAKSSAGVSQTKPWRNLWKALFLGGYDERDDSNLSSNGPLQLYIRYRSGGFSYQVTVGDEERVMLPHPQAIQIRHKKGDADSS